MFNNLNKYKMKVCIFAIVAMFICFALAVGFSSNANAEENGQTVNIHIDAGFGVFVSMGTPHTINVEGEIGKKYPVSIFEQPPHKRTDLDGYYWTFMGYYYYDNNSNKVSINENSIISDEGLFLFCDWKENHPDECRYVNVIGTNNGHRVFSTKTLDPDTGEWIGGYSTVYADPIEKKYTEGIKSFYEIAKWPFENTYSLRIFSTRDNDIVAEKWFTPVPLEDESDFKYWLINGIVATPDVIYEIDYFNPFLRDLDAIAVYEQDILNTSVSGSEGHLKYDVSYDYDSETRHEELLTLNINTVLMPVALYDPKFTYRWNSTDNSLEVWYRYLKDSNKTEHYVITPTMKAQYVFDQWNINSMKINKDVIEELDLLSMFDAQVKNLNINSSYNIPSIPTPDKPDSTLSNYESAQTGDWMLNVIICLIYIAIAAGVVHVILNRRIN